jgi:GTP-binding protein YchF
MKLGIIGLPNVGKSTLFNALTRAGAAIASYPFTTINPNVGVVTVPDPRLERLGKMLHPPKLTPTTIEFVDIAGLVKGASQGEGLGNKFLAYIREVDAIVHVVRCFEDANVSHVHGTQDPARDVEIVEAELTLADLETVEKNLHRAEKGVKGGEKGALKEQAFLGRLKEFLARGQEVRGVAHDEEEQGYLMNLHLLRSKPVLYVGNVGEEGAGAGYAALEKHALAHGAQVLAVSAKIEGELEDLSPEERALFREEMHLAREALDSLVEASYRLLELITFYTVKGDETRAWTVRRGTKAAQAAGKIHSDMERGFIKAEVVAFHLLEKFGSMEKVKETGHLRFEGHDYVVQDGDVLLIRFHV